MILSATVAGSRKGRGMDEQQRAEALAKAEAIVSKYGDAVYSDWGPAVYDVWQGIVASYGHVGALWRAAEYAAAYGPEERREEYRQLMVSAKAMDR
jgi:hypothetical protein